MPESQRVGEIRERTMGRVVAARSGVAALSDRVGSAWGDARLSQQGREEEAARAVREARPGILEELPLPGAISTPAFTTSVRPSGG
ncbi:MAG: hypothetical protein M3Q49_04075 [Actinomycetota bacterium]|nr:hypothetical protein [Actinomycetota bacterium]